MRTAIKNVIRGVLDRYGYEIRRKRPDPMSLNAILMRSHAEKPMATIFDVGANEGQSAREFRKWFPCAHIVSFEPFPPAFMVLKRHSAQDSNWVAENLALGTLSGVEPFHINQVSGANSILPTDNASNNYFSENPHITANVTEITVGRLDDYCVENGISSIDFLNIDTQGYDLEVLKGAGDLLEPTKIRAILVEILLLPIYEKQARFDEIFHLLDQHGYKLYCFIGGYMDRRVGLYWSNALFFPKIS